MHPSSNINLRHPLSRHALLRMQQRSIPQHVVAFLTELTDLVDAGGGCTLHRFDEDSWPRLAAFWSAMRPGLIATAMLTSSSHPTAWSSPPPVCTDQSEKSYFHLSHPHPAHQLDDRVDRAPLAPARSYVRSW